MAHFMYQSGNAVQGTGKIHQNIGIRQVASAGEGAAAPISGFGCLMAEGMKDALREDGAVGILTGALKSAAGGIGAAMVLSLIAGVLFKPKDKG
jgi:stage V sporulation protein AE